MTHLPGGITVAPGDFQRLSRRIPATVVTFLKDADLSRPCRIAIGLFGFLVLSRWRSW